MYMYLYVSGGVYIYIYIYFSFSVNIYVYICIYNIYIYIYMYIHFFVCSSPSSTPPYLLFGTCILAQQEYAYSGSIRLDISLQREKTRLLRQPEYMIVNKEYMRGWRTRTRVLLSSRTPCIPQGLLNETHPFLLNKKESVIVFLVMSLRKRCHRDSTNHESGCTSEVWWAKQVSTREKVYIYIYIYIHMHILMCIYVHVYIYIYIYIYIYLYIFIGMYVNSYIHTYIYVYVDIPYIYRYIW